MSKPELPPIPAKRYFTIGEVSDLCQVKPHVLRYWEQEFNQLNPVKRRGNRRYYQHHEVVLVRRIRELLYDEGFTISGARTRLGGGRPRSLEAPDQNPDIDAHRPEHQMLEAPAPEDVLAPAQPWIGPKIALSPGAREELERIISLLKR